MNTPNVIKELYNMYSDKETSPRIVEMALKDAKGSLYCNRQK